MSTVVKTEFGNFETFSDGDMYRISDELQSVIGEDVHPRNREEMEQILRRIRSRYDDPLRDAVSIARQNTIRLHRQIAELGAQLANGIREAQEIANDSSRRRLEEAERRGEQRIRQMQEEMSGQLQEIRRQQTRAINSLERKVYGDMDNMRSQLESRISSLDSSMTEIQEDLLGRITDTNKRIDATNKRVNIVQKGLTNLTNYVGDMEQRFEENFKQQESEIQSIQNKISQIESRGAERARLAIELLQEVEKNNDLDRFVHEEAEKVRRRMEALTNAGASGAELSAAANEAIISVNELEIDCTRERLKYEQQEELTRTMMETLLTTVNKLREIEISDDEGNPVMVENNFWSRGQYNALKERLESLQAEIDQHGKTDMTIERLKEIQNQIVKDEVEIQSITSQSVARVNLSQARMQTIGDIVSTMEEQHWEVIEENGVEAIDYSGGEIPSDYREGAFARLRNDMGEEVTVIVDPTQDDTKNTLGFHFTGNATDTDQENERKAEAVTQEIQKSGYEVGKPKCAGHQPMPEMESASAMTQKGASNRMRQRMNQ